MTKKRTRARTRPTATPSAHGPRTLYPGKRDASGAYIGRRIYGIVTSEAFDGLMDERAKLSAEHGRQVSINDSIEHCIRKASGRTEG